MFGIFFRTLTKLPEAKMWYIANVCLIPSDKCVDAMGLYGNYFICMLMNVNEALRNSRVSKGKSIDI